METGKKIFGSKKKYRPTVNLWSSVRIKFIVIIVTILLVVIISVATALAIAIIRPYKDLLSNSLLIILNYGFKLIFLTPLRRILIFYY